MKSVIALLLSTLVLFALVAPSIAHSDFDDDESLVHILTDENFEDDTQAASGGVLVFYCMCMFGSALWIYLSPFSTTPLSLSLSLRLSSRILFFFCSQRPPPSFFIFSFFPSLSLFPLATSGIWFVKFYAPVSTPFPFAIVLLFYLPRPPHTNSPPLLIPLFIAVVWSLSAYGPCLGDSR